MLQNSCFDHYEARSPATQARMQYIFQMTIEFKTWRKLWIALAKAEQRQGLPITDAQIAELEAHAGYVV